jgi:4-hydroxy-2-oxoheptanedioate aldolase
MRRNTLKEIWANGGAVVNGWCSIPSSFSAEVMAHQGFDSICIDMQHGVASYQVAVTMLQAISSTPVIPLIRVSWNEPGQLMRALDAGAYGVICPMINTAEQARELVSACKYPPVGIRSFGPIRAKYYAGGSTHGGGDYHDFANEETLVIPQIETREAIVNIDEILQVPGIGAVYVGPSDLAMALGSQPRAGQKDPAVVAARQEIVAACKRHNIPAGIHTPSSEVALKMIASGFQLTTIASDDRFLMTQAKEEVLAMRRGMANTIQKDST